mmetsp:Transcript_23828/g.43047  ORF Transcript_23828/g.43047 Transcript_23828/m.43047 type:complete len:207 (+) Transcript_23828:10102-10722(+)
MGGGLGDLGPKDQILDLDNAALFFLAALDDGDGAATLVGVFQLVAKVLGITQVDFSPNTRLPEFGHHGLIVGHPVPVHHGHNNRPRRLSARATRRAQGRQKAIHTNRDAGRRHFLPGKALDQIIITPAPGHRAKVARAPLFVGDLKGQLRLVNRAGVIAQAAHDRRVDDNAVGAIACGGKQACNFPKLLNSCSTDLTCSNQFIQKT